MFQLIKQILILDKNHLSKYKMRFLNDAFFLKEIKAIQTYLAPLTK